MLHNNTVFSHIDEELVSGVNTFKCCGPMVDIIIAMTVVAVKDTDGVNFLDLIIFISDIDMFGNSLAGAVEDSLQIVELSGQLHLDDDKMSFAVFGFYINTVEFIRAVFLIGFAFEEFDHLYLFSKQNSDQTFKNAEVGLVTKHMLHGPIKTYVGVV